jgi:hypothetical protein
MARTQGGLAVAPIRVPCIGGERGLAFTLNDRTGVIELWADPTPELDRVPNYPLSADHPGAMYLQPKDPR